MANSPIKKFADLLKRFGGGCFENMQALLSGKAVSWLGFIALAIAATSLATVSIQRIPTNLTEGMIAARNIKADRNYEIIDDEATQKFKDDATSGILPIYDFDERVGKSIEERIRDAFVNARHSLETPTNSEQEINAAFAEKLGVAPTSVQMQALMTEQFSLHAETVLAGLLRRVMSQPIVPERASLDALKEKGIILRRIALVAAGERGEPGERFVEKTITDVSRIRSTDEARQGIEKNPIVTAGFKSPDTASAIVALAGLLIDPNCLMNREETDRRREEAAAGVKSVILKVNAGEMIVREGSRYEPWQIKVLHGIQKERRRGMYSIEFLGTSILVFLFMLVPFYLAEKFFKRVHATRSDHLLMAVVGLSILAIMRLSLILAPAVHDAIFFSVPTSALVYAIPIAGGAMLIRMFLGPEITLVFALALSGIAGLFAETDARFVAFCFIGSCAAIMGIAEADRRSRILMAGAITGAVGAVAVAGISLVAMASGTGTLSAADLAWGVVFALVGGVGCSIFTMIVAPVVESVSGYTSDIKLLELANLNHPLLRELIVRAPGTYHHSHMVGILCEAAAEAIGAKALLVRVGAYYHDIGKMKKPFYFVENAKPGENKHERLTPHMSALIVAAHVKDGEEMAASGRIPKVITDMIPEHHGTRLISFFYEKAKEKEKEEGAEQKSDPKDFAYMGPKPQSREAAILMLADATEAAVRALKEKSSTRIQQTVQRVITEIFAEKQLDECEITLKDLNEISRAFVRILLGIYHARIEYPKDTEHEKPEKSIVDETSTGADTADKQPPAPQGRHGSGQAGA
ncbi:MAG: HDIG domain-containing metalloprotein [Pseudomonadota bacterium]